VIAEVEGQEVNFDIAGPTRILTLRRLRRMSASAAIAIICLAVGTCACSSGNNDAMRGDMAPARLSRTKLTAEQCTALGETERADVPRDERGYVIQPGDVLSIDFYRNPEFNDEPTVRPDGKITARLIGDIQAAGLTPSQLAESLDKAYVVELRSPEAAVHVKSTPHRLVFVQGQVSKPGSFALEPGMTALQAVAHAGGLMPAAARSAVLIRRDICGQPYAMKIDISDAEGKVGNSEDVALMPRDILVVPRSKIANVDLFVKHYIRGILPIPPYLPLPMR
jgi:polysaccharide biosynthesis/export protein